MDNLPYAMILSVKATRSIAHSALPDAPVVLERPRRPVTVRPRLALAHALRRAAASVSPEPAGPTRSAVRRSDCLPAA